MNKALIAWLVVYNVFKSILPFMFGLLAGMAIHGNRTAVTLIGQYWEPVFVVVSIMVVGTLILLYLEGEFSKGIK